jgi:hypothetical protein
MGKWGQPFGQKHTEKKQEKEAAFIHSFTLSSPAKCPEQFNKSATIQNEAEWHPEFTCSKNI